MVIQHNLTAMNSNRMLGVTTSAQAKSTEKLSSGYKINRAADDAAGLSISEKMRKQIRGLSQASLNAQDGISAVQTAEGALNEVQDMLQRANELAVKAANGTMSENDRSYIQDEIKQLETEIDRVAETTKFNETYLLKGDKMSDKEYTATYTSAMTKAKFEKNDPYDKFYAAGGTVELTEEQIVEKLEAGERIYTNPKGQVESTDHSVNNDWKNASATITLTGGSAWTTGGEITIAGKTVQQSAAANVDAIVSAFNEDAGFAAKYTASKNGSGDLVITANSNDVSGTAIQADITKANYDTSNAATVAVDDGKRIAYEDNGKGWDNLYLEGETTKLSDADAKQALLDGKKLYYGASTQEVSTNHTYTEAKGVSVEIDFEDWTTSDTIKINNTSYAQSAYADAKAIADALNATSDFLENSGSYRASVSADGKKLIITANADSNKTSSNLAALFSATAGESKIGSTDQYTSILAGIQNAQAESYSDGGLGWENLYAAGGTDPLEAADAKAILADGGKLYSIAATQTEAVKDVNYTFEEAEEMAFFDANGNKIAANALDDYIDIDEAGNVSLKAGKTLYVDKEGTEFGSDPIHDIADYVTATQTKTAALDLSLHVGADATADNQISMEIEAMDAITLGVKDLKVDGKDDTNALNAIETIKAAIQKVSTQRSALGAIQNRLEHTIANLDNVVENTTAAESQIRDTDMATEMVKYSNNNILAQAGQAMLAQANQSNQGVLSLLG